MKNNIIKDIVVFVDRNTLMPVEVDMKDFLDFLKTKNPHDKFNESELFAYLEKNKK
ncbi:MAG: hypothetical protein IIT97_01110 [Mycoplasmataceae bacterium]|nr:hypothetical protein [Mycoplasmataceae bacterium]